jgi:hypothetical protein
LSKEEGGGAVFMLPGTDIVGGAVGYGMDGRVVVELQL